MGDAAYKIISDTAKDQGSTTLKKLEKDIDSIKSFLSHISESVDKLKDITEKADVTLRVISDISSKTDLLALNASIEAARAGHAGKGFAVVADEVSRLSDKTQSSIEDVSEVILSIKKEIMQISEEISKGHEASKSITLAMNKVSKSDS